MTRRPWGAGCIRDLPSGRKRIAIMLDGREVNPLPGETFATHDEAAEALDRVNSARLRSDWTIVDHDTLMAYGEPWVARRRYQGVRSWRTDKSRWFKHVASATFYRWRIDAITRRHVRAWLTGLRRKLADKTVRECLILLRRCIDDAIEDGIATINACARMRLRAKGTPKIAPQNWTYLELYEQEDIADCDAPEPLVFGVLFAIFTGVRQGEQRALELPDIHLSGDPHVIVRWGGPNHEPTKNGRIRRVELSDDAVLVVESWLEWRAWVIQCGRVAADDPRLFPWSTRWTRRTWKGDPTGGLGIVLAAAGIPHRPFLNWHSLRHTCAASLVSAFWGEPWPLIEVRDHLGHTSIDVTQRYAHLAPGQRRRRMRGLRLSQAARKRHGNRPTKRQKPSDAGQLRGQDLNLRPSGYEPSGLAAIPNTYDGECRRRAACAAEALIEAAARRDSTAHGLVDPLVEAVLEEDVVARLVVELLEGDEPRLARALRLADVVRRWTADEDEERVG